MNLLNKCTCECVCGSETKSERVCASVSGNVRPFQNLLFNRFCMALNYHEWSAHTHRSTHAPALIISAQHPSGSSFAWAMWVVALFTICVFISFISTFDALCLKRMCVWFGGFSTKKRKDEERKNNNQTNSNATDKLTTSQLISKRFAHLESQSFCWWSVQPLQYGRWIYIPFCSVCSAHLMNLFHFDLEKHSHIHTLDVIFFLHSALFSMGETKWKKHERIFIQSEFKL